MAIDFLNPDYTKYGYQPYIKNLNEQIKQLDEYESYIDEGLKSSSKTVPFDEYNTSVDASDEMPEEKVYNYADEARTYKSDIKKRRSLLEESKKAIFEDIAKRNKEVERQRKVQSKKLQQKIIKDAKELGGYTALKKPDMSGFKPKGVNINPLDAYRNAGALLQAPIAPPPVAVINEQQNAQQPVASWRQPIQMPSGNPASPKEYYDRVLQSTNIIKDIDRQYEDIDEDLRLMMPDLTDKGGKKIEFDTQALAGNPNLIKDIDFSGYKHPEKARERIAQLASSLNMLKSQKDALIADSDHYNKLWQESQNTPFSEMIGVDIPRMQTAAPILPSSSASIPKKVSVNEIRRSIKTPDDAMNVAKSLGGYNLPKSDRITRAIGDKVMHSSVDDILKERWKQKELIARNSFEKNYAISKASLQREKGEKSTERYEKAYSKIEKTINHFDKLGQLALHDMSRMERLKYLDENGKSSKSWRTWLFKAAEQRALGILPRADLSAMLTKDEQEANALIAQGLMGAATRLSREDPNKAGGYSASTSQDLARDLEGQPDLAKSPLARKQIREELWTESAKTAAMVRAVHKELAAGTSPDELLSKAAERAAPEIRKLGLALENGTTSELMNQTSDKNIDQRISDLLNTKEDVDVTKSMVEPEVKSKSTPYKPPVVIPAPQAIPDAKRVAASILRKRLVTPDDISQYAQAYRHDSRLDDDTYRAQVAKKLAPLAVKYEIVRDNNAERSTIQTLMAKNASQLQSLVESDGKLKSEPVYKLAQEMRSQPGYSNVEEKEVLMQATSILNDKVKSLLKNRRELTERISGTNAENVSNAINKSKSNSKLYDSQVAKIDSELLKARNKFKSQEETREKQLKENRDLMEKELQFRIKQEREAFAKEQFKAEKYERVVAKNVPLYDRLHKQRDLAKESLRQYKGILKKVETQKSTPAAFNVLLDTIKSGVRIPLGEGGGINLRADLTSLKGATSEYIDAWVNRYVASHGKLLTGAQRALAEDLITRLAQGLATSTKTPDAIERVMKPLVHRAEWEIHEANVADELKKRNNNKYLKDTRLALDKALAVDKLLYRNRMATGKDPKSIKSLLKLGVARRKDDENTKLAIYKYLGINKDNMMSELSRPIVGSMVDITKGVADTAVSLFKQASNTEGKDFTKLPLKEQAGAIATAADEVLSTAMFISLVYGGAKLAKAGLSKLFKKTSKDVAKKVAKGGIIKGASKEAHKKAAKSIALKSKNMSDKEIFDYVSKIAKAKTPASKEVLKIANIKTPSDKNQLVNMLNKSVDAYRKHLLTADVTKLPTEALKIRWQIMKAHNIPIPKIEAQRAVYLGIVDDIPTKALMKEKIKGKAAVEADRLYRNMRARMHRLMKKEMLDKKEAAKAAKKAARKAMQKLYRKADAKYSDLYK